MTNLNAKIDLADSLTDNELRVLVAFMHMGMDCTGAEDIEGIREDNMTWADLNDLGAMIDSMSKESIRGVCGSLAKKGLIGSEGKPNGQLGTDMYATERGLDALEGFYAKGDVYHIKMITEN